MGNLPIFLILIPITFFAGMTLAFGDVNTTPLFGAVAFIQNSTALYDRTTCESNFAQCSNVDCTFFSGSFTEWPHFELCGDLFYIFLVIGVSLALPALVVALPFLFMIGPTSITILSQTITLLSNTYYALGYSFMWAMFGLGIFLIIW